MFIHKNDLLSLDSSVKYSRNNVNLNISENDLQIPVLTSDCKGSFILNNLVYVDLGIQSRHTYVIFTEDMDVVNAVGLSYNIKNRPVNEVYSVVPAFKLKTGATVYKLD